jgi:acyl dehydratase
MFMSYGRFFEEFIEGEVIKHDLSKTIFESDNNLFSLLTMNHHPVHLNVKYAENNHHEKILVVGTLVFSLVVGMTVGDISGKAVANLNYESIQHQGPCFIGDTLSCETEIISSRESKSNPNAGIIYVETRAFNQDEKKILTFRRNVLVKKGS